MKQIIFRTAGSSPALVHARNLLASWGYQFASPDEKSISHLLLPVPSIDEKGKIRGGSFLADELCSISKDTTIMGGFLPKTNNPSVDFLEDAYYITENASITAHCAIKFILQNANYTLKEIPILIIGWGRIGKCLSQLLKGMGAIVTVAVRKESDCALLQTLGYQGIMQHTLHPANFRIIINTVPAPILTNSDETKNSFCLDLASERGILGDHVYWKRGIPGLMAPESSGMLIAKTALRYALGKE